MPVAAYEFFDTVGACLRKLAADVEGHRDLAPARAELGRRLDALQKAVEKEPAVTAHANADCAALGQHVIALLAGLEGLLGTARSSAADREGAAVGPALVRLADAYERWPVALADEGSARAARHLRWGCIPSSPRFGSTRLEASQRALVGASTAVIRQ